MFSPPPLGGFLLGFQLVKIIEVADDPTFEEFCEKYDVPVFDRQELSDIFESSGWGYAHRRWKQMLRESS